MVEFPIVAKLGGRRAAFEHLRAKGIVGTIHALRMWAARGVIPGDAARELMRWADERGIAYTADDFIVAEISPLEGQENQERPEAPRPHAKPGRTANDFVRSA